MNAQWEECVRKEMRGRVLNEHFDFNPKKLIVISDKPTYVAKEVHQDEESMGALKKKLEVLTALPKKKYPYPMTASQEIGWNEEMFAVHRPKYSFNRKMFDETKYASDYVTMTQRSPFAMVKTVVEPAKK